MQESQSLDVIRAFLVSAPIVLISHISSSYCILSSSPVSLAVPLCTAALLDPSPTVTYSATNISLSHLNTFHTFHQVGLQRLEYVNGCEPLTGNRTLHSWLWCS